MADYITYRLKISTLTPMHIGSGVTLLNEYDYAVHQGQTWRLNDAALLDAQDVDDPTLAERLAQTPPARLLAAEDYQPGSPFFRYVIQGEPRSSAEGAQVQEQIKDVFDRPYLPGSSLKGALRTAIGWYGWGQRGLRPDFGKLEQRSRRPGGSPRLIDRRWAGQVFEKDVLVQEGTRRGKEPNFDLLRALQVSDSQPVDPGCLMLLNVRVLNRGGSMGAPIELEAIRPDTELELTIKLDLALFSDWAREGGLKLSGSEWLTGLVEVAQAHAAQRVLEEIGWYSQIASAKRVLNFYRQLERANLGQGRFLVQLGWGTGWDDKTFGSRLKEDRDFMARLVREYRLTRGRHQPDDPFPKSRRVATQYTRSARGDVVDIPATPFGWVLVELERKR